MSKSAFLLMETIVALVIVISFSAALLRFQRASLVLAGEGGARMRALEVAIQALECGVAESDVEITRGRMERTVIVKWKKGRLCLVGK